MVYVIMYEHQGIAAVLGVATTLEHALSMVCRLSRTEEIPYSTINNITISKWNIGDVTEDVDGEMRQLQDGASHVIWKEGMYNDVFR